MKSKILHILLIVMAMLAPAGISAQSDDVPDVALKVTAYKGYSWFIDEYGDRVVMTYIRDVYVYPPLRFANKKQEEFYWRTVRDVRKTLPYAKLAYSTLCETYEYI